MGHHVPSYGVAVHLGNEPPIESDQVSLANRLMVILGDSSDRCLGWKLSIEARLTASALISRSGFIAQFQVCSPAGVGASSRV